MACPHSSSVRRYEERLAKRYMRGATRICCDVIIRKSMMFNAAGLMSEIARVKGELAVGIEQAPGEGRTRCGLALDSVANSIRVEAGLNGIEQVSFDDGLSKQMHQLIRGRGVGASDASTWQAL